MISAQDTPQPWTYHDQNYREPHRMLHCVANDQQHEMQLQSRRHYLEDEQARSRKFKEPPNKECEEVLIAKGQHN